MGLLSLRSECLGFQCLAQGHFCSALELPSLLFCYQPLFSHLFCPQSEAEAPQPELLPAERQPMFNAWLKDRKVQKL